MKASPVAAAFAQAKRLGHDWVGPEHALLAVVLGPEDDPAAGALRDSGLEAEVVERHLERMDSAGPRPERPQSGISPNPAFYQVWGRAEGFAAGLGADGVEPVHVLLALLWDPTHWRLAEARRVSRDRVIDSLRRLGVKLPAAAPPPLERSRAFTQRVRLPADRVGRVVNMLVKKHPPTEEGPVFGFNYDRGGGGFIVAEDGIALEAIVAEALGGLEDVKVEKL